MIDHEATTERRREPAADQRHERHSDTTGYRMLALSTGINLVLMFALMFSGVNAFDEIFLNLDTFYMALIMTSGMTVAMMPVMWRMFRSNRTNVAIVGAALFVFVTSFAALRTEAGVGDRQLLRAMIPHHSMAIHMCQDSNLSDAEVLALCDQIVESQRAEIAEMREILERFDG